MIVLEALNLKKTYLRHLSFYKQIFLPLTNRQRVKALDSVSICIESGQILGIVGPNGAGKTTLLRILADILEQDAGTVSICGLRLGTKGYQMRSGIGYVSSDERSFFWRLTGKENLEFFARLYNLSVSRAKRRTAVLIKQFGFDDKADQLFRDYSSGMRKKISVMRALLHEPPLLLLDEVTNSLDPGSAKRVKEMVRQYVSERKDCAAVWSTHRLEEISQICDKVVMIDSGRIISGGLTEDFMTSSDYMLKIENFNGQIDAFCEKTGYKTKIHTVGDNMNELIISGINQKQFSRIVSMAVKDFGAYIIFAGCIKKDPDEIFEDFQSQERLYGSGC
ncbi:MAG: ABC transporter ATP-binding protein [Planctomycetota bacterium]|jgi:ABC-2 type transport system ATP-binding protein